MVASVGEVDQCYPLLSPVKTKNARVSQHADFYSTLAQRAEFLLGCGERSMCRLPLRAPLNPLLMVREGATWSIDIWSPFSRRMRVSIIVPRSSFSMLTTSSTLAPRVSKEKVLSILVPLWC